MTVKGQERIQNYIDRDIEKKHLVDATDLIVNDPVCWALYFEARGGLGKTALLEYYPLLVQAEYPQLCITQIIDFYDPENRNPIEIEHKLINGLPLDQSHTGLDREHVQAAFKRYYVALNSYRLAQESMCYDDDQAEAQRFSAFVSCWNDLSVRHPLVIRMDTAEMLFVHKPPEEALISTPTVRTGTLMVLRWIQTVLPQLRHTLVLFSGRPHFNNYLEETLKESGLLYRPKQVLQPFSDPDHIRLYLKGHGVRVGGEIGYITKLTDSRPLLLSCYAEIWHRGEAPHPDKVRNPKEFESLLLETIFNPLELFGKEPKALARALCLYFLTYARRGLYRYELLEVFQLPEVQSLLGLTPDDYEPVISDLEHQTLIKRVYVADPAPPDGQPAEVMLLFIHDEVFALIDSSSKADMLGLRTPVLNYLCTISKKKVHQSQQQEQFLSTMADHMYYELARDFVTGYRTYILYMDRLLRQRAIPEAMILGDVFWGTYNFRVDHDGLRVYPYHDALAQASGTTIDLSTIGRDEQVRHVKLLIAQNHNNRAVREALHLKERFIAEGVLVDGPISPGSLKTPHDDYLLIDLLLAQAAAMTQARPQGYEQQLEDLFAKIISFLKAITPATHTDSLLLVRDQYFLGLAYTLWGQLLRAQQRFDEASNMTEQGRTAFRNYRQKPLPLSLTPGMRIPVSAETYLNDRVLMDLAQATNNLAFTLVESGNLDRALRLSDQVMQEYLSEVPTYQQALFHNTHALIHLRRGELDQAEASAKQAVAAAHQSEVGRAHGLAICTTGLIARARMRASGIPQPSIDKEYFEEAAKLLASEEGNLRDIYMVRARFARDLAEIYRADGRADLASTSLHEGQKWIGEALTLLATAPTLTNSVRMQRADLLESRASLYNSDRAFDEAEKALVKAEELLQAMTPGGVPAYVQVVCGKIALQWAYIRLMRDKKPEDALILLAIALTRSYIFALHHHDQATFECLIRHWTRDHVAARERFVQQLRSEEIYIAADTLPYQRPLANDWASAWEHSIAFFEKLVQA